MVFFQTLVLLRLSSMTQPDFDSAAYELVTEFGGDGSYISVSPGVYDPATGVATPTTVSTPVKVVLLDLTLQSSGLSVKYGTQILAGDKEAYVIPPNKTGNAALGLIQPTQDRLLVAGVSYNIITYKELNPSGTDPILYTLYLRR